MSLLKVQQVGKNVNAKTLKSVQEKNRPFKQYLRTKTPYDSITYKRYRNRLSKVLSISKKTYYNKYFIQNSSNIKNTWKGIRELISNKKATTISIPSKLIFSDKSETKDAKQTANTFNKYFSSISETLSSSNPNMCSLSYIHE